MQRQAGVDDVLDQEDVAVLDARVQILDQPHRRRAAGLVGGVPGQLDEIDVVQEGQRARQVGQEDEGRLQRADEQRLLAGVVGGDLLAELRDAGRDLLGREVDLSDAQLVPLGTV